MEIDITRPRRDDRVELQRLFFSVIRDAFHQDGIDDETGVQTEVVRQLELLEQDFASRGSRVFFLLARTEEQIIGTIAYSEPNDLIKRNLTIDWREVPEITSVYIHPAFQGRGIGTLLFNAILICLRHRDVEKFCLDGGYTRSQRYWMRRLGEPAVTLKNYWGAGLDHLIWVCGLQDIKVRFRIE